MMWKYACMDVWIYICMNVYKHLSLWLFDAEKCQSERDWMEKLAMRDGE